MPVIIDSKPPDLRRLQELVQAEIAVALRETARYVQAKAAKYPTKASSITYKRTGTLGRSISVGPVEHEPGESSIEVGTNLHYAKFVEYGTGLYGPEGRMIVAPLGHVMVWRSTGVGTRLIAQGVSMRRGRLVRNRKRDQYLIVARAIRGMQPWHFMQKAFEDPKTEAYFKARVVQMLKRIEAGSAGA